MKAMMKITRYEADEHTYMPLGFVKIFGIEDTEHIS